MKTRLGIKGFLFVLFLTACTCCSILGGGVAKDLGYSFRMEYKYGKSLNAEREKRRIPLLPKEWGGGIVRENSITWTDPEFYWNGITWGDGSTPLRPKYYQKYVLVQGDTILETDEYLGQIIGTKYSNGDDPIPIFETIKIIHTYDINEIDKISCSADVNTSDIEFVNGECERAIKILEQWGLTYP